MAQAPQRSQSGQQLVSLLVATIIMSCVATGLIGLISINTMESTRSFNRADNLNGARIALDKMGRLIRMARNLGDVQGTVMVATDPYSSFPPGNSGDRFQVQNNNVSLAQVQAGTACNSCCYFPSAADTYYNQSTGTLYGTIGTWPWASANNINDNTACPPYELSQDTLVLQVQTFDGDGFPRMINGINRLPALDTYVYKIVPDTSRPGPTKYYLLQLAIFPAPAGITNMPVGMAPGSPQTIASNIVGPLDSNGKPAIFQYTNQSTNTVTTNFVPGSLNEQDLVLFKGIVINLEMMNVDATGKAMVNSVRSEVYLRNNSSATIMGG
jgi:hypothetical protein